MKRKLSPTAERMLSVMEEGNLVKITDIAKKLNISSPAVHGHIKRLEKRSIIKQKYSINYGGLGLVYVIFLFEFFYPLDRKFMKSVQRHKNVKSVIRVEGDFDYVVIAVFRNEQEMRYALTSMLMYNERIKKYSIILLGDVFL